jgi:hypothetical protein
MTVPDRFAVQRLADGHYLETRQESRYTRDSGAAEVFPTRQEAAMFCASGDRVARLPSIR